MSIKTIPISPVTSRRYEVILTYLKLNSNNKKVTHDDVINMIINAAPGLESKAIEFEKKLNTIKSE